MRLMRTMIRNRGQAMVEYLVIAAIVLAAILLAKPKLKEAVDNLFSNAANQANSAASALGGMTIP